MPDGAAVLAVLSGGLRSTPLALLSASRQFNLFPGQRAGTHSLGPMIPHLNMCFSKTYSPPAPVAVRSKMFCTVCTLTLQP